MIRFPALYRHVYYSPSDFYFCLNCRHGVTRVLWYLVMCHWNSDHGRVNYLTLRATYRFFYSSSFLPLSFICIVWLVSQHVFQVRMCIDLGGELLFAANFQSVHFHLTEFHFGKSKVLFKQNRSLVLVWIHIVDVNRINRYCGKIDDILIYHAIDFNWIMKRRETIIWSRSWSHEMLYVSTFRIFGIVSNGMVFGKVTSKNAHSTQQCNLIM